MANRRYIDFPIASSVGDSDIILIWQSGANKQTTKATFLSGLPENLDELNDVAISGLTNGQILRYDSVTGKWENTDQGNLDLNDLNDVSIVSPSNGQVLVYNSSTSQWENSSGGYVPYTGAVTTVNLGAQTIQAGSFVKAGGTAAQFLKADGSVDSTAYGTGTVTSVALTMPAAFSVANSPVTTAGTLAVTGAGNASQYIAGDGTLVSFPALTGYVPYTGANQTVNLNTQQLQAGHTTLTTNGSTETLTINHTSGSGKAINVTKGGAGEGLYVNKTSGSGNAATIVGTLEATTLVKTGGTSSQFLKADGSVDSTSYGTGTVTSVGLSSATSGVTIGSTPVTTSGTITLAIATASGSQNGLLSSIDWTTFNGKQNALTNPVTGTGTTNYLPKFTGASTIGDSLIFDNGSGVGINTATPGNYILALNYTGANLSVLSIQNSSLTGYSGLHLLNNSGGIMGHFGYGNASTSAFSDAVFFGSIASKSVIFTTADSEKMRIFSGGNVHIGTTPAADNGARLQVSGSASIGGTNTYNGWIIGSHTNNVGSALYNKGNAAQTMYADSANTILNAETTLFLRTANSDKLTITSSGNVLIGTTTDNGAKLQVSGTATFSSSVTAASLISADATFSNFGSATAAVVAFADGNTGFFRPALNTLGITTAGAERMRITSGGSVLVNRQTLSAASLQAVGSLQVNNEIMSTGAFGGVFWENRSGGVTNSSNWYGWYTNGGVIYLYNGAANIASINTSTGGYTALSDVNKKENFEASEIGLKEVLNLKPTIYSIKNDEKKERHLGFIAQEVRQYIPNAYVENGEFIGLNEMPIIAALTKAIQELKQEIDTLKN